MTCSYVKGLGEGLGMFGWHEVISRARMKGGDVWMTCLDDMLRAWMKGGEVSWHEVMLRAWMTWSFVKGLDEGWGSLMTCGYVKTRMKDGDVWMTWGYIKGSDEGWRCLDDMFGWHVKGLDEGWGSSWHEVMLRAWMTWSSFVKGLDEGWGSLMTCGYVKTRMKDGDVWMTWGYVDCLDEGWGCLDDMRLC